MAGRGGAALAGSPLALLTCLLAVTYLATTTAQTLSVDATSLNALMNQLTGSKPNWPSGTEPCTANWQYITCVNGRVTEINMNNLGLQGQLPYDLANMDALQQMNFANNALSGGLQGGWGQPGKLQYLTTMNLTSNQFNGNIPSNWGATNVFPALFELALDDNQLSGSLPDQWSNQGAMPSLHVFSAKSNQFSGSLPQTWCSNTGSLPALQVLYLDGNQFNGQLPANWGTACTSLQLLSLQGNQLSGALPGNWGNTGSFPNLQLLYLDNNQLTGTFPPQWATPTAFPSMQQSGRGLVILPGNSGLTGAVPAGTKINVLEASGSSTNTYIQLSNLDGATLSTPPSPSPSPEPEGAPVSGASPSTVSSPAPANSSSPSPSASHSAAAPSPNAAVKVSATLTLTGVSSALTSAQQASLANAIASVVGVDASAVTIGSSGVSASTQSATVSGRRLLQSSLAVPISIATTQANAAGVQTKLQNAVSNGSFASAIQGQGIDASSVSIGDFQTGSGTIPVPSSGGGGGGSGAAIGGAVGGVLVVAIIAGCLFWWCLRRRRRKRAAAAADLRRYSAQDSPVKLQQPLSPASSFAPPSPPKPDVQPYTQYRKTRLDTIRESLGLWGKTNNAGALQASPSQPVAVGAGLSPSRSGRLTQGLYKTSSSGSPKTPPTLPRGPAMDPADVVAAEVRHALSTGKPEEAFRIRDLDTGREYRLDKVASARSSTAHS